MEEEIVGMEEGHTAGVEPAVSDEVGVAASPDTSQQAVEPDQAQAPSPERQPPPGYENVIEELWPGEDGKPPELTQSLMAKLRSKYFTIRHSTLQCGHKFDQINQPRGNCDFCWFAFFGCHMKLVEVADQFYRQHGKRAMVGMRGEKFVKYFTRFMSTLYHEQQKRKECQTTSTPVFEGKSSDDYSSSDLTALKRTNGDRRTHESNSKGSIAQSGGETPDQRGNNNDQHGEVAAADEVGAPGSDQGSDQVSGEGIRGDQDPAARK
jgi:hypothetical protein